MSLHRMDQSKTTGLELTSNSAMQLGGWHRARIGLHIPRWHATESALFHDVVLQELLLYHLIARRKRTVYADWVVQCTLVSAGEVPCFLPDAVAVGYRDFNLDMLSANFAHPIFEWIPAILEEPRVFTDTHAEPVPTSNFSAAPSANPTLGAPFTTTSS
ncbi:hypothetical protein FB451DRAFT_1187547 [Mycena latifolia]|nr:hypothetical protein FB451DRAFT_1187547 [Mycena latifolia]